MSPYVHQNAVYSNVGKPIISSYISSCYHFKSFPENDHFKGFFTISIIAFRSAVEYKASLGDGFVDTRCQYRSGKLKVKKREKKTLKGENIWGKCLNFKLRKTKTHCLDGWWTAVFNIIKFNFHHINYVCLIGILSANFARSWLLTKNE